MSGESGGGFLGELKRRNVVKVATVYLLASWVLIQIAETTFPALHLPEWTVTFVVLLLAIFFPIALIFAWAFELTPEGLKRTGEEARMYPAELWKILDSEYVRTVSIVSAEGIGEFLSWSGHLGEDYGDFAAA